MNDLMPIELLVQTACIWEATARKIGNVHRYRDFAATSLTDFLLSAAAIAPCFQHVVQQPIGKTILSAVRATRAAVRQNTNLGIILLLAPLAAVDRTQSLRDGLSEVLEALTLDDAKKVYEAIRVANPGGLGASQEQDVRDEPSVTLLDAMSLARESDLIARQYANGFADVLDFGLPALLAAVAKYNRVEAAVIDCQLRWLTEFPDSLIARKRGLAVALHVRDRVREVVRLGGLDTPEGRRTAIAVDLFLRSDGNAMNPGTTADLVTACLYIALRDNRLSPATPFHWQAEEWL